MKFESLLSVTPKPFNAAGLLAAMLAGMRKAPDQLISADTLDRLGVFTRQVGGQPLPADLRAALDTWHKGALAAMPRRGRLGDIGRRVLSNLTRKPLPAASTLAAAVYPAAAKAWLAEAVNRFAAALAESPEARQQVLEDDPETHRVEQYADAAEDESRRLEAELAQFRQETGALQTTFQTLQRSDDAQEHDALMAVPDGIGEGILHERRRAAEQTARAAKAAPSVDNPS